MNVRLRLFASARELAGFGERTVTLREGDSLDAVWSYLERENPLFAGWRASTRFAVNQEYVQPATVLKEDDEVAVIPPVSGG